MPKEGCNCEIRNTSGNPMVSLQGVAIPNSNVSADFDVTLEGVMTDRRVGTNCGLDVSLYDIETKHLFHYFNPCSDTTIPSEWFEASYLIQETPLRIIQENGPFSMKFSPTAALGLQDMIEVSFPQEILKGSLI